MQDDNASGLGEILTGLMPKLSCGDAADYDLDFARTRPCRSCPFRNTTHYYEPLDGLLALARVFVSGGTWTCHQDADQCNETGELRGRKGSWSHCAGMLLFFEGIGRKTTAMRVFQAREQYLPGLLEEDPSIFTSVESYLAHIDPGGVLIPPDGRARLAALIEELGGEEGDPLAPCPKWPPSEPFPG